MGLARSRSVAMVARPVATNWGACCELSRERSKERREALARACIKRDELQEY